MTTVQNPLQAGFRVWTCCISWGFSPNSRSLMETLCTYKAESPTCTWVVLLTQTHQSSSSVMFLFNKETQLRFYSTNFQYLEDFNLSGQLVEGMAVKVSCCGPDFLIRIEIRVGGKVDGP